MSTEAIRLPIWATVGSAFGLFLRRLPHIVRVGWFPAALLAATFSYMVYFSDLQTLLFLLENMELEQAQNYLILFYDDFAGFAAALLFILLLLAVLRIGFTKTFFGEKSKGIFAYFSLGKTEFRNYGAQIILLFAIIAGVLIAAVVYAYSLAAIEVYSDDQIQISESVEDITATIFAWTAIIGMPAFYAIYFAPISGINVSEGRIGLFRSRKIVKGNRLRIFGSKVLLLTVLLPLFLTVSLISDEVGDIGQRELVDSIMENYERQRERGIENPLSFSSPETRAIRSRRELISAVYFFGVIVVVLLFVQALFTALNTSIYLTLNKKPKPVPKKIDAKPSEEPEAAVSIGDAVPQD